MTASRAQTSFLALLASATFPLTATAQPEAAPASQAEREIVMTGATEAPPAVVYGAPNLPVVVSFDSPLWKDGIVAPQGAEVRPHAFVPNAIVITPSSYLTPQTPIPVSVRLADRMVVLTVAFSPGKRDTNVRIIRRAASECRGPANGEQELLRIAAKAAIETCADADATAVPRPVEQGVGTLPTAPLVCGGGVYAYMLVSPMESCAPAKARLTRGDESAEVLLLQQSARPCEDAACWVVVARAPDGDGKGFVLELLADDGVPCYGSPVNLKPSSP